MRRGDAGGADRYRPRDRGIVRANGCLRLEDGTLAGSLRTMDEAVRYVVDVPALPLVGALVMASRAPAEFLRRGGDLGRIAPGYLASMVHLDEELRVRVVWVEGDWEAGFGVQPSKGVSRRMAHWFIGQR